MISTYFFIAGTLLVSLNFVRLMGMAISDWLYILSFVFAVFETFRLDRINRGYWLKNRYLWFAFFIFIGAMISMSNSRYLSNALVESFQLLYVITVFISLIAIMERRGKLQSIVRAFVISGLFSAIVALTDYFTGSSFGPALSNSPYIQLWGRYAGTLGHPNKFGYFLTITVICTMYLIGSNKKGKKVFWIISLLIQVMGIYLSGSLTAYLGVLLGVSVIFINMTVRKIISFPAVFFIILSLFIMFFSAIYFADVLGNNPVDIENIIIIKTIERVRLYTVDSRLVVYDEAFQRILESPFLGVGFDQISTSGIARNNRYIYGTVHNAGIQVLYVGGVISFIGFVLIYLDLFVKSLKALFGRKSFAQHFLIICLAAATLAIILMDQFQDALYQREKWLMFGMFVSLMWPKLLDRKKEEMDNENC